MESDSVIISIALLLIERHGAAAGDIAAERARVLEGCRDRQLARTWDRICRRIDRIMPPLPAPAPEPESLTELFELDQLPELSPAPQAGPAGEQHGDDALVVGE